MLSLKFLKKKHDKKIKVSTDIGNYIILVNLSSNLPPRVKIPFFTGEKKLFCKKLSPLRFTSIILFLLL
jgi:hypothetical protein